MNREHKSWLDVNIESFPIFDYHKINFIKEESINIMYNPLTRGGVRENCQKGKCLLSPSIVKQVSLP
jgi:hypothetical protein